MNCNNCGTEVTQNFCPNCGQALQLKRIDRHYVVHEIEHVLHVERGIFYTIKELLIRPGIAVRQYISENRMRLVKPIIFIIISSLIYSLLDHLFHVEENYVKPQKVAASATASILMWVQSHYGYANIIMGLFIAFWTKLFFRKYDYNFFEVLILLCFVIGMGMILLGISAVFQGLLHVELFMMSNFIVFLYCIWAIAQFYDGKKLINYVKAFFAYLIGTITALVFAFALGLSIDVFLKH